MYYGITVYCSRICSHTITILVVCIGDADSVLLSPDEVRPAQGDAGIV